MKYWPVSISRLTFCSAYARLEHVSLKNKNLQFKLGKPRGADLQNGVFRPALYGPKGY